MYIKHNNRSAICFTSNTSKLNRILGFSPFTHINYDASAADDFWKHRYKRRNCSLCRNVFKKEFSNYTYNYRYFPYFKSRLQQIVVFWKGLRHHFCYIRATVYLVMLPGLNKTYYFRALHHERSKLRSKPERPVSKSPATLTIWSGRIAS